MIASLPFPPGHPVVRAARSRGTAMLTIDAMSLVAGTVITR